MRLQKIYVAGHRGMVGSAILRSLQAQGFNNIVTRDHSELDLTNQAAVQDFFQNVKPDQVFLAAAKVGGIHANNTYPAEFIYNNLMIEANVINAAFCNGVKKLLFIGSSSIYPKYAPQPIEEDSLLHGQLESTNEPYAVAKIAGIKLCESYNRQYSLTHGVDYRSVVPANLYGLGDNYHAENAHVIPALIRRFHEAKITNASSVTIWGTGKPMREFLYVDDMADACVYIMNLSKIIYDACTSSMVSHINIGSGYDITIKKLAETVAETVGYEGVITFDSNKPDGIDRKLMSSSRAYALGWKAKTSLFTGLQATYKDFIGFQAVGNK